jgi:transposase
MGSKKSRKGGDSGALRDRLAHIRACEKSGGSLKAYAERHGLSVYALYQAKKIARQRGLLPPHRSHSARRPRKKRPEPVRFAEAVVQARDPGASPTWRLRLASGDVIESHATLEHDQLLHLIRALRGDE